MDIVACNAVVRKRADEMTSDLTTESPSSLFASESFAKSINAILGSLVIWTSPWAGILLVDDFWLCRTRIDLAEIYGDYRELVDIRWPSVIALLLGMLAGWACGMGSMSFLQGPVAKRWVALICLGSRACWSAPLSMSG